MKVLDHGSVELVETWGTEERIIEAARMSTGKGFQGWGPVTCFNCQHGETVLLPSKTSGYLYCPRCGMGSISMGDEKLLAYLYNNKHATPFEMCGLVIEVQAPIFVFREWHRHRTQSYNEMSSRYTPLPDVNYVPSIERLMQSSKSNKQAGTVSGAEQLTPDTAALYQAMLQVMYQEQEELYQIALRRGVPKELARLHLPVGRYSRMRASANLRNWLGFLTLRLAPGAQWEIRQYAEAVAALIAQHFPRTWRLFDASR